MMQNGSYFNSGMDKNFGDEILMMQYGIYPDSVISRYLWDNILPEMERLEKLLEKDVRDIENGVNRVIIWRIRIWIIFLFVLLTCITSVAIMFSM